jgi:SAM-dependent methyltransferase
MTIASDSDRLLASEQAFFDAEARQVDDAELAIPPEQMARYRRARRRPTNIPKETMFALLRPLAGKRVLEYGCGTGHDSCHLADCGGTVTAFDLSPVSIQKARRRAELLGLGGRIAFDVKAGGKTGYPDGAFDVVVGIAILHHLHTELDGIYGELNRLLAPGGAAYFIEPVANSRLLRALRPLVPVPRHATPDERQLTYADLELLKRHGFRRVEYHHFYCFARLKRILGEWSARPLRWIDHYAQRWLPPLKPFYGIVLVVARR